MTSSLDICIEAMILKTKYTTSTFKPWKEKVLVKMKLKITELKQKIKPKEKNPQNSVTPMLKSTWINSIENLLLSPLTKHQTIFLLYAGNIAFPNY